MEDPAKIYSLDDNCTVFHDDDVGDESFVDYIRRQMREEYDYRMSLASHNLIHGVHIGPTLNMLR